jgi:hypothetical protein
MVLKYNCTDLWDFIMSVTCYNGRFVITAKSFEMNMAVVTRVDCNLNLVKFARDFNSDHKTIVRLVRKFNTTRSVDDLPRRPKHRAMIRQYDRYMQINSPSWQKRNSMPHIGKICKANQWPIIIHNRIEHVWDEIRQESETASPAI